MENRALRKHISSRSVARRAGLIAGLLLLVGCVTGSVRERFPCPEDVLVQWQIPGGWLVRELTPTQARVEVLDANISKDSAEARWEILRAQFRDGDRYWLYVRPEEDTLNHLGVQEGVVLLRECVQLGFVTTRIAVESASGG
jgi:hypothetical protein